MFFGLFGNKEKLSMQGQEAHVNTRRGRKANMRHVQRMIRCKQAMEKPNVDRHVYDDLANEIHKHSLLLQFEGFTVPDDIPGLEKLFELTRIS